MAGTGAVLLHQHRAAATTGSFTSTAYHSEMTSSPMFIVTQVAAYPDGPAGVHGVLTQAASGLGELAVMAGLEPVVVTDVATHACLDWDDYPSLVGARFDGHPWTQEFEVEIADRTHPSTAHLAPPWRWH